jgi:protein-S-isoprenylcysteine O-methyltransferase Ste14
MGISVLALGYVGTLWCYATIGDNWRIGVNRDEKTALATTGPYRFVRHPIYVFQVLMLVGVWLLLPTVWSVILVVVDLACIIFKAREEDQYLLNVHGDVYRRYAFTSRRKSSR